MDYIEMQKSIKKFPGAKIFEIFGWFFLVMGILSFFLNYYPY